MNAPFTCRVLHCATKPINTCIVAPCTVQSIQPNRSINPLLYFASCYQINQPINQSINQPTAVSINQSAINQSTAVICAVQFINQSADGRRGAEPIGFFSAYFSRDPWRRDDTTAGLLREPGFVSDAWLNQTPGYFLTYCTLLAWPDLICQSDLW